MKRALAITLTVAMIGALAFMGFAGTAAASNHDLEEDFEQDVTIDTSFDFENVTGEQTQDLGDQDVNIESGDATNEVHLDQTNNNAQVADTTAGDAVALSNGAGAAGAAAHDKGGAGAAGAAGAGGGATAASMAETNQVQDVNQINAAQIDQTADTSIDAEVNQSQDPTQDGQIGGDISVDVSGVFDETNT